MNTAQRQNLLNIIEEFKKTDLESPFKEKFKNAESIDAIRFGDYSITELFSTSKKAVLLLEDFLEKNTWQPLQYVNVIPSSYNNTLLDVVKRITDYFKTANYEQAAQMTNQLVQYEMRNGFWNKNKKTGAGINKATFDEIYDQAKLTLEYVTTRGDILESLINNLEVEKVKFEGLMETQRQEIDTIRTNQTQAGEILTDMRIMQERASTTKQAIDTLNDKADDIITELEASQEQFEEQIKENSTIISDFKSSLANFQKDAEQKLQIIKENYDNVSTNANEVRKMMHFIKDGALAHSFNIRTRSIHKAVITWGIFSFFSAILMGAWICIVFTYLNTSVASDTVAENSAAVILANLVINLGKTSPMVVLFGFSLSQYIKERNLQEEYAFKEAVAVTLTAYLDQLDGEEDEHKRMLLMNTVEKLYTKPVLAGEKGLSVSLSSKDIAEALKNLGNTLKVINNPQNNKL